MELKLFEWPLSVCKLDPADRIDLTKDICFIGRTDEELSLVCKTGDVPAGTLQCEDGWRGFRIVINAIVIHAFALRTVTN